LEEEHLSLTEKLFPVECRRAGRLSRRAVHKASLHRGGCQAIWRNVSEYHQQQLTCGCSFSGVDRSVYSNYRRHVGGTPNWRDRGVVSLRALLCVELHTGQNAPSANNPAIRLFPQISAF